MEDKFKLILDDDEKIVEVLRPNKEKLIFSTIFGCLLIGLIFCLPLLIAFITEETETNGLLWIIPVVIFVLILVIAIIVSILYYNKTYYAFTNKRLVVRTGIIGVDYKSLDMKTIGAINVYVSLIDKILHKNTGSLRFGSMSSPINGQNSAFNFSHITNPYENYKKIKEYIENIKK